MDKLRPYIFVFLTFCVFSSKNIIIYNEEVLVALSFFSFILFISHYYGNTIKESLNERGLTIKSELQNIGLGRKESKTTLLSEYKRISTLPPALNNIDQISTNEVVNGTSQVKKGLKSFSFQEIKQKLKTLAVSKLIIQQKLQQLIAMNLLGNVQLQFQGSKKKQNSLETAIQILSLKQ